MNHPTSRFSPNYIGAELLRVRRRATAIDEALGTPGLDERVRGHLELGRRRLTRDEQVLVRALLVLADVRAAARRKGFLDGLRTTLQHEKDALYHDQEAVKALNEILEELGEEIDVLEDGPGRV
jgi:hypothetical protein